MTEAREVPCSCNPPQQSLIRDLAATTLLHLRQQVISALNAELGKLLPRKTPQYIRGIVIASILLRHGEFGFHFT